MCGRLDSAIVIDRTAIEIVDGSGEFRERMRQRKKGVG